MPRRQRTFRRAVAALVALPVLLFAVSFVHGFMRCRVTGAVVEVCACPDDGAPRPEGPKLLEQTCCEWQTVEAMDTAERSAELGDQSGGTNSQPARMPLAFPFVVPAIVTLAAPSPFLRTTRAAIEAHSPQPALILVKQSFLI